MVNRVESPVLTQKSKTEKLLWLDLLRGVTAFAVFIGHLRTLYFVDFSAIEANVQTKVFFFFTGFGHQSVIIFFVLSGFFIAKTTQSAIDRHRWRFKDYLINRIVRLETVLLPTLILGLCLDTIGLHFFSQVESYMGQIPSLLYVSPVGKLDLATFFGNVLFLQNITADTFGSNAPLWSLANEFWYYMIFPLLYFSLLPQYPLSKRLFFSLLAISILVFVGKMIALYFLIWAMGAVAFYVNQKYSALLLSRPFFFKVMLVFASISLVTVLFFTRVNKFEAIFNDYSLGFVTGFFVLMLSLCKMENPFLKGASTYLSNISYTLYLTHIPAAMLLCAWISTERHTWNYTNLLTFSLLTIFILLYATLSWYLFERNTPYVKTWVKQALNKISTAFKDKKTVLDKTN